MDIIDIVLSKKYTDESLKGITGTLAGKNCTIKSATKVDGVTTVVFAWTADDGTEKTTTIQVNDGVDGKDTSQEAVLFIEQKLDDAQRTQARENIGAADAARQNILTGSEIGNPIVVDDAFSAPLSGLTLYGKSTQVSTTGANILKDTYLSLCKGDVDLFTANGLFTANSNWEKPCEFNLYFSAESIFTDGIKDEATYYFVFRPIGFTPKYRYQLSLKNEKSESFLTSSNGNVTSVSGADLKKNVRIQLYFFNVSVSEPVVSGSKFQMIFSQKPDCNYEPYTGGKPSPSPEYPQEIESAGQDGEIGVAIAGTNLLPFEVGQKGNGFEVFADGVQIDVDKKTDIYAVGRFNGDVESGYDEFALMTAGKYYIYSGTQDVYLYVVVWRKGENVVLGYSVGTNVAQIEIMDGDKFRIFIRTKAAFNGKVKAMITRTPMNATSYEPYRPAQTLIIPTPNGLPGVPTIDNGNYTDASGQQWLCDEVNLKRGVYVQNVAFAEFGKGITSLTKNSGVSSKNIVSAYFFSIPRKRAKTRHTIMSNCLRFVANVSSGNPAYVISNEFQTEAMYVSIPAELYENDDQMLNLLAEKKVKILYATYPTERPLSTEELEKYRSLRTYSPTTTLINDAGAGTQLDYQRDVNISIKKLEDAIASMTTT